MIDHPLKTGLYFLFSFSTPFLVLVFKEPPNPGDHVLTATTIWRLSLSPVGREIVSNARLKGRNLKGTQQEESNMQYPDTSDDLHHSIASYCLLGEKNSQKDVWSEKRNMTSCNSPIVHNTVNIAAGKMLLASFRFVIA